MPVNLSYPSPQLGDVNQIYHASGTQGTGTAVAVQLAAASIPAINAGDILLSIVTIRRETGIENINCGTHVTTATVQANYPHYLASTDLAVYYSSFQATLTGGSNYNSLQQNYDGTLAFGSNLTYWGDLSTLKTVYLNMIRRAATTFSWDWVIYRLGNDVK